MVEVDSFLRPYKMHGYQTYLTKNVAGIVLGINEYLNLVPQHKHLFFCFDKRHSSKEAYTSVGIMVGNVIP